MGKGITVLTVAALVVAAAPVLQAEEDGCDRELAILEGVIERTRLDAMEERRADAAMDRARASLDQGDEEACLRHAHEVKLILHLEH